jgi:P-type Mg2+ transporter
VDTAVDIAKESADIILLEKSLTVLGDGIIEGRKTFINIMKYIKMALSSNFGNILSVLGASIFLPFLPMLPAQLLIQNLIYDMSQLAIPFDKVDKELIRKPRNWCSKDLLRFMLILGPLSSMFDYITFASLWFYFGANSLAEASFFQSGWFIEGLLTQTLIVHLIRTRKIPFIQTKASVPLLLSTLSAVILGAWLPFSPLAISIGMVALPINYMVFLGLIAISYWGSISLLKRWYIHRFRTWI